MQPLNEYYLWCDHRAKKEAAEITELAHTEKLPQIGTASSATCYRP